MTDFLKLFKLRILLHWFIIYIVCWILEEIVLRLFIRWWFGRWFYFEPSKGSEPEAEAST